MAAVEQSKPGHFDVRLDGLGGLLERMLGGAPPQVDPFLIARAITEVMRRCTVRAASGGRLLWNEYRVILAPADFAHLQSLEGYLERDLGAALTGEATRLGAALVGELCVHVVADESGALDAGRAVIRVGFAPTAELAAPQGGEMTVRLGAVAAGVIEVAPPVDATVAVAESVSVDPAAAAYILSWPGGSASLPLGVRAIAGRPHPGAPPSFIALAGAPATVNKQQVLIIAMHAGVVVGRLPGANPVQVDGVPLTAGQELEVRSAAVEVSLSRGALALTLRRAGS